MTGALTVRRKSANKEFPRVLQRWGNLSRQSPWALRLLTRCLEGLHCKCLFWLRSVLAAIVRLVLARRHEWC